MMKTWIVVWIVLLWTYLTLGAVEKITYFSLERANVTYINPKYVEDGVFKTRRYSRTDPMYYGYVKFTTFVPLDSNIMCDIYFYEFLTNRYKRGFVEFHFSMCSVINHPYAGPFMKNIMPKGTCPYPAGTYEWKNITVPAASVPRNFPFTKGRIYLNFTYKPTGEKTCCVHIDVELKEIRKTLADKLWRWL